MKRVDKLNSKPVDACVALHGVDKAEREELVVVVVRVIQCCKQSAKERPARKTNSVFQISSEEDLLSRENEALAANLCSFSSSVMLSKEGSSKSSTGGSAFNLGRWKGEGSLVSSDTLFAPISSKSLSSSSSCVSLIVLASSLSRESGGAMKEGLDLHPRRGEVA